MSQQFFDELVASAGARPFARRMAAKRLQELDKASAAIREGLVDLLVKQGIVSVNKDLTLEVQRLLTERHSLRMFLKQ